MAGTLRERGVSASRATQAAQVGMAAFVQASDAWLQERDAGLDRRVTLAFADLASLLEGLG